MRKLFETVRFFERNHARAYSRVRFAELSDWSLRDIGFVRQARALDAVKPFWMA